jgi:formylglycine-generating enzyme required for sulfatase activity
VGLLKPNDFGLFDVHGNVRELCLNRPSYRYAAGDSGAALDEEEADLVIKPLQDVLIRGGSFNDHPRFLRAANRDTNHQATTGSSLSGLRLARTIRWSTDGRSAVINNPGDNR